jgi:Flp pilus assembly pilin Flp
MKALIRALKDETGAATAEYAIATMAAVGFAGMLVVIMRSEEVKTILFDLVRSALTFTNPNGQPAE